MIWLIFFEKNIQSLPLLTTCFISHTTVLIMNVYATICIFATAYFDYVAIFWAFSLAWGILCSLPHTLGMTSSSSGNNVALSVGTILYTLGFVTESLADYQKWQFKKQNPGKFCNVGLWSVSQHPNYFGNIILWIGIWIMNGPSLVETSSSLNHTNVLHRLWSAKRVFLSLLSPLFIWSLFDKQASGGMLNSAEMKDERYGNDATFLFYKETVPLIVPKLLPWLKKVFIWN